MSKTVKGQYYFAEPDAPPIPVPTYLASALFDPEAITEPVLGERRGGFRKWTNGVLPVPPPPAVVVADANCDGFSGLTTDLGDWPLVAGIDVRCWLQAGVDPPPWIPPMITSGWLPVATDVTGVYTDSPLRVVDGCVVATACLSATYYEIGLSDPPPAADPTATILYADGGGAVWTVSPAGVTDRFLSYNANLADLINVDEARDHLGLGSAAVEDASAFQPASSGLSELDALVAPDVLAFHDAALGWVGLGIGSGLSISGGNLVASSAPAMETGALVPFAGATPPAGYLLCDGSAVSRSTYAALFAVIGTTWGAGDGSTTFNLPDLRGRVPVGAGTGAGLTPRTLGATGGEEEHVLTIAEMPEHDHPG